MFKKINGFFAKKPIFNFILLAILFAFIEGVFSFCSKKKDCPAFADASFDAWFPYQEGQIVYFKTLDNKTDSLNNFSVTKSEARTIGGLSFSPVSCYSFASIQSHNTKMTGSFINIDYNLGDDDTDNYLRLIFNNFNVDGLNINDTGIVIYPNYYPVHSAYFTNLTLNNKHFSNVQMIQEDTTDIKISGLYKIWIAKNMGLIGYEEYPSLTKWVKQ